MESKDSLPCSQQPVIGLDPEPGACGPHLPTLFP